MQIIQGNQCTFNLLHSYFYCLLELAHAKYSCSVEYSVFAFGRKFTKLNGPLVFANCYVCCFSLNWMKTRNRYCRGMEWDKEGQELAWIHLVVYVVLLLIQRSKTVVTNESSKQDQ